MTQLSTFAQDRVLDLVKGTVTYYQRMRTGEYLQFIYNSSSSHARHLGNAFK